MRKTIRFTRIRFFMLALSVLAIGAGVAGTIVRGGLTFSVDLSGGISQQIRIADAALEVSADPASQLAVERIPEDPLLNRVGGFLVEWVADGIGRRRTFSFDDVPTVGALAAAIGAIDGVVATRLGPVTVASRQLRAPGVRLRDGFAILRSVPATPQDADVIALADVRAALAGLGRFTLQAAGAANEQSYIIRTEVPAPGPTSSVAAERVSAEERVLTALGNVFGSERLDVQATDFVGESVSRLLGRQSVAILVVALVLTFIYIVVRFRWTYAIGAMMALVHDVAVMIGVLATFQFEVGTATIAAVLTIVGYSLNDTIVIFDRVRENVTLMRDSDFDLVINSSITQSLARTIITSLTTLMAVTAIYVFGSASIQTFALTLMIGVVVGTYSSIFVASPTLLALHRARTRRATRAAREAGMQLAAASQGRPGASAPTAAEGAAGISSSSTAHPTTEASGGGMGGTAAAQSGYDAPVEGAPVTQRVQPRRQSRRRRNR